MNRLISYSAILLVILNSGTIIYLLIEPRVLLPASCLLLISLILLTKKEVVQTFWRIALLGVGVSLLSLFYVAKYGRGDLFMNQQDLRLVAIGVLVLCTRALVKIQDGEFMILVERILRVLAVHAILCCIIITAFPTDNVVFAIAGNSASNYLGYNWFIMQRANIDYLGFAEATSFSIGSLIVPRAHGIFWEPGNFSLYANILLHLNLFQKLDVRGIGIALTGILLSYSTSGLSIAFFQVIAFIAYRGFYRSRKHGMKLVLAMLPIISFWFLTRENIALKFAEGTTSGSSRLLSTISQAKVWLANPLGGAGHIYDIYVSQVEAQLSGASGILNSFSASVHGEVSFTNSVVGMFAMFGLLCLPLFYGLFNMRFLARPRVFGLVVLLGCSSAPLFYTPFIFFLCTIGLRLKFV
ncbi:MAG: hypothetical protein CMK38_06910 [Porticoccaceae bacterium]|nr:hypothetical protein [Porticoccaceae bacterium]